MAARVHGKLIPGALILILAGGVAFAAPDLGHKTMGTLGLGAGSLPPVGVDAVEAVFAYRADRLYDRNGTRVPMALDASFFENILGISGTYDVPRLHTSIGATFSAPVARVSISTDDPRASLDDFGLGDLYVQPLRLGWRLPRGADIVTSYAFYAPTGQLEPGGRGGVGHGQWTHQVSLGGTIHFDRAQRWTASALLSYEHDMRKLAVDLTRGATLQLQGGVGAHLARRFDLGVTGYALWQVADDTGSARPPLLAGARDVDYGLGPELDVSVTELRTSVTVRYTHDVAVRSRALGELVMIAISVSAWTPR